MTSTAYSSTWISNLRHRHQLSLRALSHLTGIPKSSLHDLESGRHQPDGSEHASLVHRLSSLTSANDKIPGLRCLSPRPAQVKHVRHQLVNAAAQASRVLVFFPALAPWLTASRFVRYALELPPGTSVADYLVRYLIEPADRSFSLIHPIPQSAINRLECRAAEFAAVPESTLKKQFAYFLNELIDERNIHLPIVSDDAVAQMSSGFVEVTAVIVFDDAQMLRVLNTSSIEWIDAAGSDNARQLIASTLESFHCMLASATDPTGQSTLYSSYESLRKERGISSAGERGGSIDSENRPEFAACPLQSVTSVQDVGSKACMSQSRQRDRLEATRDPDKHRNKGDRRWSANQSMSSANIAGRSATEIGPSK